MHIWRNGRGKARKLHSSDFIRMCPENLNGSLVPILRIGSAATVCIIIAILIILIMLQVGQNLYA